MFVRRLFKDRDRDFGFSLPEVLVVVLIIGVLTSIAVPLFRNQQVKAGEVELETALISASNMVITDARANNGRFPVRLPATVPVPAGTIFDYQYSADGLMFVLKGTNRFSTLYAFPGERNGSVVVASSSPPNFVASNDAQKPSLSGTITTGDTPILSWTVNSLEPIISTQIFADGVEVATTDGDTKTWSGGKIYDNTTFHIIVFTAQSQSPQSNQIQLYTSNTRPNPPTGLTIESAVETENNTTATLTWEATNNTQTYTLYQTNKVNPIWTGTQTQTQITVPNTASHNYYLISKNKMGDSIPSRTITLSGKWGKEVTFAQLAADPNTIMLMKIGMPPNTATHIEFTHSTGHVTTLPATDNVFALPTIPEVPENQQYYDIRATNATTKTPPHRIYYIFD